MKNLLLNKVGIIGVSFLIPLCSISVHASTKYHKNELPIRTYDYKCHVNLLGGIDTVHFVNSPLTDLNEIAASIVGKTINPAFLKNKTKIYKVVECVKLHDEFNSDVSKKVDSETVR